MHAKAGTAMRSRARTDSMAARQPESKDGDDNSPYCCHKLPFMAGPKWKQTMLQNMPSSTWQLYVTVSLHLCRSAVLHVTIPKVPAAPDNGTRKHSTHQLFMWRLQQPAAQPIQLPYLAPVAGHPTDHTKANCSVQGWQSRTKLTSNKFPISCTRPKKQSRGPAIACNIMVVHPLRSLVHRVCAVGHSHDCSTWY